MSLCEGGSGGEDVKKPLKLIVVRIKPFFYAQRLNATSDAS